VDLRARDVVDAGVRRFDADHVVVATASYQDPRVPEFATRLDADRMPIHSNAHRHPSQLKPGGVLFVGAVIFRVVFHRILTVDTPTAGVCVRISCGRACRRSGSNRSNLTAAGGEEVPRMTGVRDGKPFVADGRVLDVSNGIWGLSRLEP